MEDSDQAIGDSMSPPVQRYAAQTSWRPDAMILAFPRLAVIAFVFTMVVMTDEYLGRMLGVACDMADAQGATLFLVDGEVLRPYLVYRLPVEYISGIGIVRIGTQCCGRAVEHRRPWIVTDMLNDPLFADGRAGSVASSVRAAFSVPVVDGNEVLASLACHFTHPHSPSAVDIERNQAFARLFAISLRARNPLPCDRPYFVDDTGAPPNKELPRGEAA